MLERNFNIYAIIYIIAVYDYVVLRNRLREMAFLTKGIKIILKDNRGENPVEEVFHYDGGIKQFVEYLNKIILVLYL